MSPLDEQQDEWAERVQRYRKLSELLGEDATTAPLRALALEMERNLRLRTELRARHEQLKHLHDVLIAEIDVALTCARSRLLRAPRFSAASLREESRLCREEANAALATAVRRAFASRALDLAMLAEHRARNDDD